MFARSRWSRSSLAPTPPLSGEKVRLLPPAGDRNKAEQRPAQLEKNSKADLATPQRRHQETSVLVEHLAGLPHDLRQACKDVRAALAGAQDKVVWHAPGAKLAPPAISLRSLVDGKVDLAQVLATDDFLGTQEVPDGYDLSEQGVAELTKRNAEAASQIHQTSTSPGSQVKKR